MDTAAVDNKRHVKRESMIQGAKIIYGNSVIDCVVQNLSSRGARVRTACMMNVPEQVTLQFRDGTAIPAQRRWARGLQIGLRFDAPTP